MLDIPQIPTIAPESEISSLEDVMRALDEIDMPIAKSRLAVQNGVCASEVAIRNICRKQDIDLTLGFVCRDGYKAIYEVIRSGFHRYAPKDYGRCVLYWRVRPETDVFEDVVVRYAEDGPDTCALTGKPCFKDPDFVAVTFYARLSVSAPGYFEDIKALEAHYAPKEAA